MLDIRNIDQYYGGSHILRDVSLTAEPGTVTVLLHDADIACVERARNRQCHGTFLGNAVNRRR